MGERAGMSPEDGGLHFRRGCEKDQTELLSERFDESRAFYNDVIGLDGGDGLDWILFFGTDQPEVQLSVMKLDIKAHVHPDASIEVDDVDSVHDRARAAGAEIVYPLTDEEWGLRVSSPRSERRSDQRHGASLAARGEFAGLGQRAGMSLDHSPHEPSRCRPATVSRRHGAADVRDRLRAGICAE